MLIISLYLLATEKELTYQFIRHISRDYGLLCFYTSIAVNFATDLSLMALFSDVLDQKNRGHVFIFRKAPVSMATIIACFNIFATPWPWHIWATNLKIIYKTRGSLPDYFNYLRENYHVSFPIKVVDDYVKITKVIPKSRGRLIQNVIQC